jgi:hypothetical protein
MYKNRCFLTLRGRIPEIQVESGNPRTLLCNFGKFGNSSGKNVFYRIRSAQQVPQISGNGFSDIFFRKCHKFKKVQKKQKNAKNKKNVPKTLQFWVFYRKMCAVEHWKSVENDTEIRCTLRAHFSKIPRAFSGFQDFQLRIEEISEKGVFDVFWKNFHFFAYRLGRHPIFTWGENLNFAFFEKCGTRFRFWVRFCAALLNPSGRKWRRLQITLGCCAGGQFSLRFFVQIPAVKWRQKKNERFAVLYRIWK